MLQNAIVIRFKHINPDIFILSHRKGFIKAVSKAMNCFPKDVVIISVQKATEEKLKRNKRRFLNETILNTNKKFNFYDSLYKTSKIYQDVDSVETSRKHKRSIEQDLDVLFTVKKPLVGTYYSTDAIRKALSDNLDDLADYTKLNVEEIAQMKCTPSYCMSGVCQDKIILDTKQISPISTDVTSFVSPKHKRRLDCICKEGFAGARCETIVNNCAHDPCPTFKICIPDGSQQG